MNNVCTVQLCTSVFGNWLKMENERVGENGKCVGHCVAYWLLIQ